MVLLFFCFPIDYFFKLGLVGQILLTNASNFSLSLMLRFFFYNETCNRISVEAIASSFGPSKVLIFLLLFCKEELMLTASL